MASAPTNNEKRGSARNFWDGKMDFSVLWVWAIVGFSV
jgi:hypothetical protein